jgi:hypothetical protein
MKSVRVVATLLGLSLVAAACGGGPEQTQLERDLEADLTSLLAPVSVVATTCIDEPSMARGSIFTCEAVVADSFYEVQVEIIDEQGRFEYERRHSVIGVLKAETSLGADASTDLGREVTADCGDNEYLVVSVLNVFQCQLTLVSDDGAGPATRNIEVKVLNADQNVEWILLPN